MKLDRAKKYEGLGLTWEYSPSVDSLLGYAAHDYLKATVTIEVAQSWLDAGHIHPVREKKTVRVEECRVAVTMDGKPYLCAYPQLPDLAGAVSKPFTAEFEVEVEA